MLEQNTYTDMVDLVLRYLKSVKGSPQDLVCLFDSFKEKVLELSSTIDPSDYELESSQLSSSNTSPRENNRQGSKLIKLVLKH